MGVTYTTIMSSGAGLLSLPKVKRWAGQRASPTGPFLWNSLPPVVREQTAELFTAKLKTHLSSLVSETQGG